MRRIVFVVLFLVLTVATANAQNLDSSCNYYVAASDETGLINAISAGQANGSCNFIYIHLTGSVYHLTNVISATNGANALPNVDAVNKYVRIYGNGSVLTVAGGYSKRLVYVGASSNLYLFNLTVIGGNIGSGYGGAIYNAGYVYTSNTIFAYNNAAYGGAMYNANGARYYGWASQFDHNVAGQAGGAIYSAAHSPDPGYNQTTLFNSSLFYNQAARGGAIFNNVGLSLNDTYVSDNTATSDGGGIASDSTFISARNSTISNNTANTGDGGGIWSQERVFAFRTQFIGNQAPSTTSGGNGGAIAAAAYDIDQSIFRYNYAADTGGAIYGLSTTDSSEVTRSEFLSNFANYGAAIDVPASHQLTASNNTFAYNTANYQGVITASTNSTVRLDFNTIISNNIDGLFGGQVTLFGNFIDDTMNTGSNCATFTSLGYNVFTQTSDRCIGADDRVIPLPGLNPLTDNGGGMLTFALDIGSPLANQVPYGTCQYATDQRGMRRYHYGGCDIGAYESDHLHTDTNYDRLITPTDGIFVTNRVFIHPITGDNIRADINQDSVINYDDVQFVVNQLSPTPILHYSCPSLGYTCSQLTTCAEAMACDYVGNPNLDTNYDGIPCNDDGETLCQGN